MLGALNNGANSVGHYLGLDSSTQSLSAIIIDTDQGKVVTEHSISFGQRLGHYQSPHGFLPDEDSRIRRSDPLMWVEALELLFDELKASGADLAALRGISGAGQQHGSVYLNRSMKSVKTWSDKASLRDQVRPLLSRLVAPIWMDSSTTAECAEISAAVGGDAAVVAISGSRAIERFTAAQIRKFFKEEPDRWAQTAEIHLVSSFVASLLVATTAGIDLGDGAGMNLLDLAQGAYSDRLLEATAPGLATKLAPPVASATRVGVLDGYFVRRFGFKQDTPVIAFSGDNPSSLIGMGASRPGTAVISLGTSDTVFAAMSQPRTDPRGYGHVFGNPAGGFMSLICFANGSLARERIAQQHELDWDQFSRAILEQTRPGNENNLMLPYFVPEMTPKVLRPEPRLFGSAAFVEGADAAAAARAIVEAQGLTMRYHSAWIGEKPEVILVTGGASRNPGVLQVLADIFQAELRPLRVSNSSALGGALRAANAVEGIGWDDLCAQFAAPDADLVVLPNGSARGVYDDLGAEFERRLSELLKNQAQS
jgi:xylulokinase